MEQDLLFRMTDILTYQVVETGTVIFHEAPVLFDTTAWG